MSTQDYFDNHIIDADDFDQDDLERIEDESPVIQDQKARGHELVNNNFPNLIDDLFQSFYQYDPTLRIRIPEYLARNQMFLEELVSSPDYAELRISTKNDDFASALASINLTENLLEKLAADEELREQFKKQPPLPPEKRMKEEKKDEEDKDEEKKDEEKEEGEDSDSGEGEGQGEADGSGEGENQGEGEGQADGSGEGSGEGDSQGQGEGSGDSQSSGGQSDSQPQDGGQDKDAEDVKDEVSDQQDDSGEMTEEEQAEREAQARALRNIIRDAADKTKDDLERIEVFTKAYGTSEDELKKMSFDQRLKFIERIKENQSLIDLAQRVGRFQRMLKKAKMERSVLARQEVVGITQSNDIQRQTPREHAMRKKAPLDWARRAVSRKLQTYKLEGEIPMGKGPVVICIDKSGSMEGHCDQWATAVMFAVMAEAAKDKRTVHVCFYNHSIQHTQTLIGGQYGIADLIRLTEFAPNGGTDFDRPLIYAYDRIKEDKELRLADIVFITDGGCRISPNVKQKLVEQRSKQDISMFTILIGMDPGNNWTADLEEISDEVHTMNDLLNETEKTASAFASMANNTRI